MTAIKGVVDERLGLAALLEEHYDENDGDALAPTLDVERAAAGSREVAQYQPSVHILI